MQYLVVRLPNRISFILSFLVTWRKAVNLSWLHDIYWLEKYNTFTTHAISEKFLLCFTWKYITVQQEFWPSKSIIRTKNKEIIMQKLI